MIIVAGVRGVDRAAQPVLYGKSQENWGPLEADLVRVLRSNPMRLGRTVIRPSDAELEAVIDQRAGKVGATAAEIKASFLDEFDVYALMVFGTFEHSIVSPYPAFPGTEYRMNYVAGATAVLVDAETGRIIQSASAVHEGVTAGAKAIPSPQVQAEQLRGMYASAMEKAVKTLMGLERLNDKHDVHPIAIMGVRSEDRDGTDLLSIRGFPARYSSPCDFLARCTDNHCAKIEALVANAAAARLSAQGRVVVPPFWSDWVHAGQHQMELRLSFAFLKDAIKISHNLQVEEFLRKSRHKLIISVKNLDDVQRPRPDRQTVDQAYGAWMNIYAFQTEGSCQPQGPPAIFAKFDNQASGGSTRIQTKVTMGQPWTPAPQERQAFYLGAVLDALSQWK